MVKVSQIKYVRPQKEQVLQDLQAFKARFEGAASVEEFLQVHQDYKVFSHDLTTNMQIAFIRFTLDTRDKFYSDEQDYLDEITPAINVACAEVNKCYLTTPFKI